MAGRDGDSLKEHRLVKVGEALATGKARTMKDALMQAGLSESTAHNPKGAGYTAEKALVAYEKKKLGKKGLQKATEKAKEMVVEAIGEGSTLDYPSRLKLAGWLVEHDLKRQQALGRTEEVGVSPVEVVRYRAAFMRAVQKGILLALLNPERAGTICDRLGEKLMTLASLMPEEEK